jgi:hypothetical protein
MTAAADSIRAPGSESLAGFSTPATPATPATSPRGGNLARNSCCCCFFLHGGSMERTTTTEYESHRPKLAKNGQIWPLLASRLRLEPPRRAARSPPAAPHPIRPYTDRGQEVHHDTRREVRRNAVRAHLSLRRASATACPEPAPRVPKRSATGKQSLAPHTRARPSTVGAGPRAICSN